MALRCAWTISSRGATVLRHGNVSRIHHALRTTEIGVAPTGLTRSIHRTVIELQPTKVPMTEEERKLLEKLGEPDQDTRGYLNELYEEFDVGKEKRREQRQQRKQKKDVTEKNNDNNNTPSSSACSIHIGGNGRLPNVSFIRSLHTSASLRDQKKPDSDSFDGVNEQSLDNEMKDASRISDDLNEMKPSMRGQKVKLTDEAEIIWDHQEKLDRQHTYLDYYPEQQKVDPLKGVQLDRGESGVFDVDELVDILREERLLDVVVIEVPPKLPYADYIVICTAMSVRQARAITQHLKKMFKRKKSAEDTALKIEGKDCDEWKVLDMGNIVLHIFDHDTREKYDLETLWTVGADMDDLTRGIVQRDDVDILEEHMNFVRSLTPQHATVQSTAS